MYEAKGKQFFGLRFFFSSSEEGEKKIIKLAAEFYYVEGSKHEGKIVYIAIRKDIMDIEHLLMSPGRGIMSHFFRSNEFFPYLTFVKLRIKEKKNFRKLRKAEKKVDEKKKQNYTKM